MENWFERLKQQYEKNMRDRPGSIWDYSKSHWIGCDWGSGYAERRIELPTNAPAEFISCNACLIREGHIRILPCNPRVIGWPHETRQCEKRDYGLDCETWARVRGAGELVEDVLRSIDAEAQHPVTWAETGLVPFYNGDFFFSDKSALDDFVVLISEAYPGHFDRSAQKPCYCYEKYGLQPDMETVAEDEPTRELALDECTLSHCMAFKADFGFFPQSHDSHTP